jgi:hypothetical protein
MRQYLTGWATYSSNTVFLFECAKCFGIVGLLGRELVERARELTTTLGSPTLSFRKLQSSYPEPRGNVLDVAARAVETGVLLAPGFRAGASLRPE